MTSTPNISEQLTALAGHKKPEETVFLHVGKNKIPVRFKSGGNGARTLIISFHGAVDRKTREVPAFVPWFPGVEKHAHQLSVSDPSMSDYDGLSIAWYIGSESFNLQTQLTGILDEFAIILGVSKTIFFGTSGGGFSALYNNWHSKNRFSMAIVGNPQTNIAKYYEKHIRNYLSACWPSLNSEEELFNQFDYDVTSLYQSRFSRTVIYVQSAADEFHLCNHLTPFLTSVADHKAARLILDTGFWGRFGHSPSFDAYLPWIKAALISSSTKKLDILNAKIALDAASLSDEANPVAQRVTKDNFKVGDIKISDTIQEWLLSQ